MKILFILATAAFFIWDQAEAFAPTSSIRSAIAIDESSSTALGMGLLSRFRRKKEIVLDPIEVGGEIPETDVQIMNEGEIVPISVRDALGNGTSILVGMPGAFTKTCSGTHMPGYIEQSGKLNDLGVETIAVVTTNDKFVNGAWAKEFGIDEETLSANNATSLVKILSDGDGEMVRELGLVEDMGFGVGIRSKRFALVVEDGKVTHMEVDDGMEDCFATSAENLVKILTPEPVGVEEVEEQDEKSAGLVFAGVAALALLAVYVTGDHTTTVSTVASPPPVSPAAAGKAAKTSFDLLSTYR